MHEARGGHGNAGCETAPDAGVDCAVVAAAQSHDLSVGENRCGVLQVQRHHLLSSLVLICCIDSYMWDYTDGWSPSLLQKLQDSAFIPLPDGTAVTPVDCCI